MSAVCVRERRSDCSAGAGSAPAALSHTGAATRDRVRIISLEAQVPHVIVAQVPHVIVAQVPHVIVRFSSKVIV